MDDVTVSQNLYETTPSEGGLLLHPYSLHSSLQKHPVKAELSQIPPYLFLDCIANKIKIYPTEISLWSSLGQIDALWSPLWIGLYAKHLERWLAWFPRTQIHLVSGERLISDPSGELGKVQDFLGLQRIITDKHFYFNKTKGFPCLKKPEGSSKPHCLGKTKGRTHAFIDPMVMQRLRDFYKPHNRRFYQMAGQDFGWQ